MNVRIQRRAALALSLCGLTGGAVAAPAMAMYPAPPGGGSTTPAVNMERVLVAAQLDPHRSGNQGTKGSRVSVRRVERRLHRKRLLAKRYVDGSYGSKTKAAYARWQRRLGYSGIGANGLPGPTSLRKLLGRAYRLTHVVSTGRRVSYDGHTINARTRAMLRAAAHRLGAHCHLGITQGSYNPGGVGASAGTHDGGGAVDLDLARKCGKRRPAVVRAMRTVGFAAWYRPTIPGVWNKHIHAIAISDPDLSAAAADQVWDYHIHRDGLADNGPDNGPRVRFTWWERYRRSH